MPSFAPFGHRRHRVLLVHHRQVVEDALLIDVHPPDAVLDDDRDLVGERRVVARRSWDTPARTAGCCRPGAAALRRRASCGPTVPPSRKPRVRESAGRPDQVADALEAEHRVVDEERDRVHAVRRVGGAGGDERRHRSGLVDPFLENLAVRRFLVIEERVHVDRLVDLAGVRVDADLAEQRLHAEGARFVGHDRHDQVADFLVAQQLRQQPHEHHRRRRLAAVGALVEFLERRPARPASAPRRGPCASARSRRAPCAARACT